MPQGNKKFFKILYITGLIIYVPLLICVTFFEPARERHTNTYEYHFIPLQSTIAQIKDPAQYYTPSFWRMFTISLCGNFLLFVPVGFFLKAFVQRSNIELLTIAFFLSAGIETAQLLTYSGVCDVDDVILNCIGASAGIFLFKLMHRKSIHTLSEPDLSLKD